MKLIAFLGDVHGLWERATTTLAGIQKRFGRIDFAVAVGDSEPYRVEQDLAGSTSPAKYKTMGQFSELVSGRLQLVCPLYFIGGNHDPYLALEQEGPGCWWGNTYYLGRSGLQVIEGIRIGFLSGIYSPNDYSKDRGKIDGERHEKYLKRLTHYNDTDITNLRAVGQVDLLVTHDWPSEVPQTADKRFPGDPILRELHEPLKPRLHVAGHCHSRLRGAVGPVAFHALPHGDSSSAVALYRFEGGEVEYVPLNRKPTFQIVR